MLWRIIMVLTLFTGNEITSLTLPDKVNGRYWLTDSSGAKKYVSVEAFEGEWILKSTNKISILNDTDIPVKSVNVQAGCIYNLIEVKDSQKFFVFAEAMAIESQTFTKFLILRNEEIQIGRSTSNDIIYQNDFVSGTHAILLFDSEKITIRDNNSTNGTYVNGTRIQTCELKIGDCVYIMGLKLVIGKCFVAFNNPGRNITYNPEVLGAYPCQKEEKSGEEVEYELPDINYFYRSPRFKRDIERKVFKIDSPPQSAIGEEIPFMLVLGPSLTMGMASMTSAAFSVMNAMKNGNMVAAIPSITMSGSMLLGCILWPLLSKSYEKRKKRKKEAKRQKKYRIYLDEIAVKIQEEGLNQEEILRENHITIKECENRIMTTSRKLWERTSRQNDFLIVRLGIGELPLVADISYSEKRFSLDDDNLQEELYTLCEMPKVLKNVPITISLFENYILGIVGERNCVKALAKGLILQLTALFAYDELKLVILYDNDEKEDFQFVKWLPHVWSDNQQIRFIATNETELKEISVYLEREIEKRSNMNETDLNTEKPYYVIFSLNRKLANRAEVLKQLYCKKINLRMSVITFYDEIKNIPNESLAVVEIREEQGKIFDMNDISGKSILFKPDVLVYHDLTEVSKHLMNVPLDLSDSATSLPQMITFLELFDVGKVEHLNSLNRWKENDPTKTLQTEVGVDAMGERFFLDLHEKFHGPHGLVAGMTGSGKSEFIITYILSMAVNYHPNEVAFILIDYKGGGMAKSFEKLPHTAGIITNLDGAAIKRSLVSIESELKRRQSIFADAGKKVGVSNIDIYKYQKLYREGKVSEPLQHLFIISDEFAELKTQQPEFMTQLISAARIGRSLGVHLILATQKPSGVVDDQIWSNSKFRVCLKVQERSDSMDMLKRPDAAELSVTGRFYLQVGYNELFEMGQSAWAGAPYFPSDQVVVDKDDSVSVINLSGQVIKSIKMDSQKGNTNNPQKQLDVITEYLRKIAEEEKIKIRSLWLDPIPEIIFRDELIAKYHCDEKNGMILNPVIGEYDDPAKQRQCILRLPITEAGNTILYGSAESGKTTFLNTMIYSLIHEHTPKEVNLYVLDFASETLRVFASAPHVGDVVLSYEKEKIHNLFKMLYKEMTARKKLLSEYGGDFASFSKKEDCDMPSIVVVIHNFMAFTELYEEKEEAVGYLSREGSKYGIYFVLTALSTNAVRFRLLQNFKQLLTLQLNDENDYATIVGKTEGLYPSKWKGRGLVKLDSLYEFQAAHIVEKEKEYSFIMEECRRIRSQWQYMPARKIPVLPEYVNEEFLIANYNENALLNIPIGVNKNTLNVSYWDISRLYINLVLSSGDESYRFVTDMLEMMKKRIPYKVMIFDTAKVCGSVITKEWEYFSTKKGWEEGIQQLFDIVLYRNNTYKEGIEKNSSTLEFERIVVVLYSVVEIMNLVNDKANEMLGLILEKGETQYGISILCAEKVKNLSTVAYDKWYKKHVTGIDGLWIGNGFQEQYQLKPSKSTVDTQEEIDARFGFYLKSGTLEKIKVLNNRKEKEVE